MTPEKHLKAEIEKRLTAGECSPIKAKLAKLERIIALNMNATAHKNKNISYNIKEIRHAMDDLHAIDNMIRRMDDMFVREHFYQQMDELMNMCRTIDEELWWEQKAATHIITDIESTDAMNQASAQQIPA